MKSSGGIEAASGGLGGDATAPKARRNEGPAMPRSRLLCDRGFCRTRPETHYASGNRSNLGDKLTEGDR